MFMFKTVLTVVDVRQILRGASGFMRDWMGVLMVVGFGLVKAGDNSKSAKFPILFSFLFTA